MCLKNLFSGDCTWILFIIILILLVDDDCGCGNAAGSCGGCNSCNTCL
ncbi:MAG: hypothetical protein IJE00_04935 [Clostridia bacterium]|nr:hypothetical protein [Clostridia bacterium]MBQ2939692.1 hypothetical protein [Clostridia bacterium]